jgi:hypothetical protein
VLLPSPDPRRVEAFPATARSAQPFMLALNLFIPKTWVERQVGLSVQRGLAGYKSPPTLICHLAKARSAG